jgi:hypothetical protein
MALFKEITADYSENHRNSQIQNAALFIVETDGTYIYHWALKG